MMKTTKKTIVAALAAAIGLGLSGMAMADGKDHRHGHHQRHWDRHGHKHHAHRHHTYRHTVREHVVIERPVYVAPRYAPVYSGYYYAPPPRYPGVVVSVDIPPLVIPLR